MPLDYNTLLDVQPQRFGAFGFDGAEPYVANASEYFDGAVKRVVDSPHVWTGDGQPGAATTILSNSLALDAAVTQMRAGSKAMFALTTAITRAQQELRKVVSDLSDLTVGTGLHIYVSPDGIAGPETDAPGGWGTSTGTQQVLAGRSEVATLHILSILNYAQSADLTAKAVLGRILHTRPVFSASASARTVAYNAAVRAVSAANLKLADLSLKAWDETNPLDWRPIDPDSWSLEKALKGTLGIDLDQDLDDVLKDIATDVAEKIWSKLPGGGVFTGVFDGYLLGLTFIHDGYLRPRLADDSGPGAVVPAIPGVDDARLRAILGLFYLDPTSVRDGTVFNLAEGAWLQRTGGHPGEDYLEQARELRDRLERWFENSYVYDDLPSQGTWQAPEDDSGVIELLRNKDYRFGDTGITPEDERVGRALLRVLNHAIGDA